jgi:tetratricopeptide (TPR) repeat protein
MHVYHTALPPTSGPLGRRVERVDPLRAYWDLDDLDATERCFRELLERETDEASRAEVLTQLARVAGLRGDFDQATRLIEEAEREAGESARARVRVDLEHGRIRRSSGDAQGALRLFEAALEAALDVGEEYLAADAAHMAALAAPDRNGFLAWTQRGIEVAESSEAARYWLAPLLNNLGWELFEAGEHARALEAFERTLAERERDPDRPQEIAIARYAVAKTLRVLGRTDEALRHMEQAVAADEADGWFQEELAETYAVLGRSEDAAAHAGRALALLPGADPAFESDENRKSRLKELADAAHDRARRA